MLSNRFFSAVLLIAGTSIGGATLALPAVVAGTGFYISLPGFILCWVIMTFGALSLLEVSLALPEHNFGSMVQIVLGKLPASIFLFCYMALLMSLLVAYISAIADIVYPVFQQEYICKLAAAGLVFIIAYGNMAFAASTNMVLVLIKLALFICLTLSLPTNFENLVWDTEQLRVLPEILMALVTAFGFAIIVPSLRGYLDNNAALLKKAVIYGSVIPLVIYLTWCLVNLAAIAPAEQQALYTKASTAAIIQQLTNFANGRLVDAANFFYSLCILTSLIGVAVATNAFLHDIVKTKPGQLKQMLMAASVSLVPLTIVLAIPDMFLQGFKYAGYWCIAVLALLPNIMLWRIREDQPAKAILPGGSMILYTHLGLALLLVIFSWY